MESKAHDVESGHTNFVDRFAQSGVYDIKEIKPVSTMREHENSIDCIAANPKNENEFLTGSHDRTIKVWDASTAKCVQTITGNN